MKFSRRIFLKTLATSGLIYTSNLLAKSSKSIKNPIPGQWAIDSGDIETSGILLLDSLDVATKVSKKMIYGDGHGHVVPIGDDAWKQLLKKQRIVIWSEPDSAERIHSHWIRVVIS